jgi:hypothetical protein
MRICCQIISVINTNVQLNYVLIYFTVIVFDVSTLLFPWFIYKVI